MKSGLYIVATPIGNLGDISKRALEVLENADVIACEDTRVTKKLFSLLGLSLHKNFIPFHDHNEELETAKILNFINEGKAIALVSDAGSPLISDPGYKLIKKCKEENVYMATIPGACAIICALQLSGLPTDRFLFAGFVPNKEKARIDFFEEIMDINATLVCYETAPRIIKSLEAIKKVFKNPQVSVAREITKIYEECKTGSVDDVIAYFSKATPKGEMVLMINQKPEAKEIDLINILKVELEKNNLKTAVDNVVKTYALNKNVVYKKALELKNER